MMRLARLLIVCVAMILPALPALGADAPPAKPSMKEALAKLKMPPPWFATTQVKWDVQNKPWKEGRLEIRRLLGGNEDEVRQAVKLNWLYLQKNDIGDGHEWPMYWFLSGNYDYALVEYRKFIDARQGKANSGDYVNLASCYAHFGEYELAFQTLARGQRDLPQGVWRQVWEGDIHSRRGDILAEMGKVDEAKAEYAKALALYPQAIPKIPYGKPATKRKMVKIDTKVRLLTLTSLEGANLRDGTFVGKSLGYADKPELEVSVTVRAGKITDVKVKHGEKIDLNSTTIIPARIVQKQSLVVDNVTGATITTQGIIDGAFHALKQAGLQ